MKAYVEIFLVFLRLGICTFGGGYAIIPVVERELIKRKGWVTMDEVMDYYTIAQITPGLIAINLSTFVGYKQKGPLGGVLATLGFVLPGITLVAVIAVFIQNFASLVLVRHAFAGIRVAVGALILDTVIKLVKGVFKDYKAVILYAAAFVLSVVFKASPMLIVLGAGLAALALYRPGKTEAPPAVPPDAETAARQPGRAETAPESPAEQKPPPEREGKT